MIENFKPLLPGLDAQYKFLVSRIELNNKNILVVGSESEAIAALLASESEMTVNVIVEDYDSLINSKLRLNENPNVKLVIMDFEFTDFDSDSFDLVYAQASISASNKNKIIKELKRILKPGGLLCVGEITTNVEIIPKFIQNIFDNSNILPSEMANLKKYYSDRNFEYLDSLNLTFTLKDYYSGILSMLNIGKREMTAQEKSYHKKLLNKIGHEAKVYLNQGGEKYFGFTASLLKKNDTGKGDK